MTKEPLGKLPETPQMDQFAFYHKANSSICIVKGTKISDVISVFKALFQTPAILQ